MAFRIDGIESQGRLAAATDTGDNHQLVFGNADIDILEVMGPRTNHFYLIFNFLLHIL